MYQLKITQKPEIVQYCNKKYRKDVVLAVIFCFAYLNVKDTEHKILSDRFEFSTHNCKNKREKNIDLNAEQSSMIHISTQNKYTHFQKSLKYSFI